jgi:hypothetical protein
MLVENFKRPRTKFLTEPYLQFIVATKKKKKKHAPHIFPFTASRRNHKPLRKLFLGVVPVATNMDRGLV